MMLLIAHISSLFVFFSIHSLYFLFLYLFFTLMSGQRTLMWLPNCIHINKIMCRLCFQRFMSKPHVCFDLVLKFPSGPPAVLWCTVKCCSSLTDYLKYKLGTLQGHCVLWDICLTDTKMTFTLSHCLISMVHMARRTERDCCQLSISKWDWYLVLRLSINIKQLLW